VVALAMSAPTYDFILAGGGLAGLSLAWRLARGPLAGARLLIVDPASDDRLDHALCFWASEPPPFAPLVARSWDRLAVVDDQGRRELALGRWRYHYLPGRRFTDELRAGLAALPGVGFQRGRVRAIESAPGGLPAVQVDGGEVLRGRWVFDSRPPADGPASGLTQRFSGWWVETERPAFDPAVPTLFDFRGAGGDPAWRFFYLLPLDERRALVELVRHQPGPRPEAAGCQSDRHTDRDLHLYLTRTLGAGPYRVLRREGGHTALTDRPFARRLAPRVMAIGARGGQVKPSTGYAFTRIQRDSDAILRSLLRHGHPFAVPADPPFYRLCDSLLLDVLAQRRAPAPALFTRLFERNPAERVLRFLDQRASASDCLRLMASMPSGLFVGLALARLPLAVRDLMEFRELKER
jgi:lycopene beta-cyclase